MMVVTTGCCTTFETITDFFSSQNGLKFNKNYGPDRLELIIFDIIGKKIYNHPSRLQL